MIITNIYLTLKKRMVFSSKSAFSRGILGARNSLSMIERRGRISERAYERAIDALKALGHMDLVVHLLVDRMRQRMPGHPAVPDHLMTATIIVPATTDAAMAVRELRGRGFPVRYRKVMPNARPDATYGEYVLETNDDGAVYGILSGLARPGSHDGWRKSGGLRP